MLLKNQNVGVTKMNICEFWVQRYFDPTKFEIKGVYIYEDPNTGKITCIVDFVRKDYRPDIDCEQYCSEQMFYLNRSEEEYEECIETCKENLEILITGSIKFDPVTLEVYESTIPGTCYYVWGTDEEEWKKEKAELLKLIESYGCKYSENWIHPHEIAELGVEYEEEYPAICYYHLNSCRLPAILKIVEEKL